MKIEIEKSPYGDEGVVYDGQLGMMQHYILQLKSFRSPNKTKEESEYLEADIRGYQEIVQSGSEENALNFLRVKQLAKPRFKNNEEVIARMKANGLWQLK